MVILSITSVQAQLLKRLKQKAESAVDRKIDKTVEKMQNGDKEKTAADENENADNANNDKVPKGWYICWDLIALNVRYLLLSFFSILKD